MALALLCAQRNVQVPVRAHRRFRDRTNPLDNLNDAEMFKQYRFTRQGCIHIIDLLEADLAPQTNRNKAIPAAIQVFTALKYYAEGCVLTSAGKDTGISLASASRVIKRVTNLLCEKRNEYIVFPSDVDDVQREQGAFYRKHGFPKVVGAVDCTHVQLRGCPWGPNEHVFINRKNTHSVNVQLICDSKYRITNVVARWPGATHDSRILLNSQVGERFETGALSGTLLGDSGYPLRKWLMTPILRPNNPAEHAYNK